jgi:hypothetical protein
MSFCWRRLLLQVYDAFAELVTAKVSALRVGDGMAPDTTHGPLITPAGVEKVCHPGLPHVCSFPREPAHRLHSAHSFICAEQQTGTAACPDFC